MHLRLQGKNEFKKEGILFITLYLNNKTFNVSYCLV